MKMNLVNRRIIADIVCPNCTRFPETAVHVLWDCDAAQDVWAAGPAEAIGHLGSGLRPLLIKRPPNSNNILYNIPSKNCLNLEYFLTHETYYDIDGLDLFLDLKVLKKVL